MSAPELFLGGRVALHCGDSREVLRELPDASIHAVVCDPPYALVSIRKRFGAAEAAPAQHGRDGLYARASAGFMGKDWDTGETAFAVDFWAEVLRVLKPGGHVIAASGTRTYHRLAVAIEDAGFEIRDQLGWLYGSGFPKSHDVSKGIDRAGGTPWGGFAGLLDGLIKSSGFTYASLDRALGVKSSSCYWVRTDARGGLPPRHHYERIKQLLNPPVEFTDLYDKAEREVIAIEHRKNSPSGIVSAGRESVEVARKITAPATDAARQWQGWGTALKPAWEPFILARKPLDGTVAANVLAHGTGALNIDGTRIGDEVRHAAYTSLAPCHGNALGAAGTAEARRGTQGEVKTYVGRWPANVLHDGSPEVVGAFPDAPGPSGAVTGSEPTANGFSGVVYGYGGAARRSTAQPRGDSGSAARFFYQAEKDERCDLCRVLLNGKNAKHLSCDAIAAEPNSQIPNTRVEGTAHFDAVGSQPPERGGRKLPSSSHVHVAGNRSGQCHQRGNNTALSDALTLEASRIAPSVRSAANLCGSCETDIARSLAATRLGLDPASLLCLEFMPEREGKILSQHLALYVAGRESIDTITTTVSLKTLFGSVFHAIADTTNSEKAVGEENTGCGRRLFYSSKADAEDRLGSKHPTVKPVALMQWLCRLVCPPGGVVLDPFSGTGTTGEAAWREGFSAVLIEREAEYQADIRRRMALCLAGPEERKREAIKARHGDLPAGPLFADPEAAE